MRHSFDVVGAEKRIRKILATLPGLAMHGFAVVGEEIVPIVQIDEQRAIERAALLHGDSVKTIVIAAGWVKHYLLRDTRINRQRTSYGLKHIAERQIGYVANGQFIMAMLLMNFHLEVAGNEGLFNVTEASVQRVEEL